MFYLACTRFNNATYEDNMRYRNKHNYPVIYGSALKIRETYPLGAFIFVLEMNNQKNLIEGIGLIENKLVCDRSHKIYDNSEYNQYIYRGKYWLSRDQLDTEITNIFDNSLFKGKSHLKCRIGITVITDKLLSRWGYDILTVKKQIKQLFDNAFDTNSIAEIQPQKVDTDTDTFVSKAKKIDEIDEIDDIEDIEEVIIIVPKKRKRTNNTIKI